MSSKGLYINNGIINKRVDPNELEQYLSNGWKRGMKPRSEAEKLESNERRRKTCQEKYGVDNPHQLDEVKLKTKQTCLQKYGVDNPAKNAEIIEKAKQTNAIRWPDPHNYHNLLKAKETLLARFGTMENFYNWRYEHTDWDQTIQKQIATKHKNNTFNYSQPEEDLYKELQTKYDINDIVRNYKDERYPFCCDFYIKSEDLFIELNRHWTHGGHTYNPDDPNDQKIVEEWSEKAETSEYMAYAIINWTIRDPLKLEYAKTNNLNYKIIW